MVQVQQFMSNKGTCRQIEAPSTTILDSSNDVLDRNKPLSVTEDAPDEPSLQALTILQACTIVYRHDSGKVFQISRAHPKRREVLMGPRTGQRDLYFSNAVDDMDHEDLASEGGQARVSPRAGRQDRTAKRMRRGSSSPISAVRTKRRPVENRQATIKSDSNSVHEDEDEIDELQVAETETQQIRVRDVGRRYYHIAFRSTSQLCCKDIAKAWIHFCHPKKQTTHPYNGSKSCSERSRSNAVYDYPGHFTKPDYWPPDEYWGDGWGSRHTEPDHLRKPERLLLLVHLLRSQHKGFVHGNFDLDKLIQSTVNIHLNVGKHWTTGHYERLEEIYRVRAKEMQFERGEIDGDTLVNVQMPKSRRKARKATKLAIRAQKPVSARLKDEPEENFTTSNAPVANMSLNMQAEDGDLYQSERCEPGVLADTSSSVTEVTPEASYTEPILCKARTVQRGSPFFDSPSPTDRRDRTVQENWTPQPASLEHNRSIFMHPNPFSFVTTGGEVQNSLPLRDQYHFRSSSMQSIPCQDSIGRQDDHESKSSQRVANRMRPNATSTHGPPDRPVAPKVGNICHPTFAASSSGLVGAFPPTDVEYSSWQIEDLWNPQMEPSMYTTVAGPSIALTPSTNGSFSSAYSDIRFSSGLQFDNFCHENPTGTPSYCRGLDEDVQQRLSLQAVQFPGYQPLGMNASPDANPHLANQSLYAIDAGAHTSLSNEHRDDIFFHDQRQL